MTTRRRNQPCSWTGGPAAVIISCCLVIALDHTGCAADLAAELTEYPFRLVWETYRNGNWELLTANADGSHVANLTRTPAVDEMYPHVSPDGKKITFVVDEIVDGEKNRNVYSMNMDGSERVLVAKNARQSCWNHDGTKIAYLKGESQKFSYTDYATKGIWFYDLASRQQRAHRNADLYHLYNPCWSPDDRWFIATVHAGMGYRHAILAIEADGDGVFDLKIPGCRPDISPDGKQVAWGASDWVLRIGDLDFSGPEPKVVNIRDVIASDKPMEVYHVDWSPDGKYIAFSRGPHKKVMGRIPEIVGTRAQGWDICVADASARNRWVAITSDGQCNKEPDWIPIRQAD